LFLSLLPFAFFPLPLFVADLTPQPPGGSVSAQRSEPFFVRWIFCIAIQSASEMSSEVDDIEGRGLTVAG
jgi:hypothetical protein